MPTTQLSYWTRDRKKGDKISIEFLVHKQTARNAAMYGFNDRGSLEVGKRADINVIDYDNLNVATPVTYPDLPAGGTRIMMPVNGYKATYCNGGINSFLTCTYDLDTSEVLESLKSIDASKAADQLSGVLERLGGGLPVSSQQARWDILDERWTDNMNDIIGFDTLSIEADDYLMIAIKSHVMQHQAFYLTPKIANIF